MNNLKTYINKLNTLSFIIFSSFLAWLSTIPFYLLAYFINYNDNSFFDSNTSIHIIFISCTLLGPLIESVLILFIIKITKKIFKKNTPAIILSCIIFSSLHYTYGYLHVLAILVPSFIFISSYIFYETRNKYINSFIILTIIHGLYNLYSLLFGNLNLINGTFYFNSLMKLMKYLFIKYSSALHIHCYNIFTIYFKFFFFKFLIFIEIEYKKITTI